MSRELLDHSQQTKESHKTDRQTGNKVFAKTGDTSTLLARQSGQGKQIALMSGSPHFALRRRFAAAGLVQVESPSVAHGDCQCREDSGLLIQGGISFQLVIAVVKTWCFRESKPGWKPGPRGIQTKSTASLCLASDIMALTKHMIHSGLEALGKSWYGLCSRYSSSRDWYSARWAGGVRVTAFSCHLTAFSKSRVSAYAAARFSRQL